MGIGTHGLFEGWDTSNNLGAVKVQVFHGGETKTFTSRCTDTNITCIVHLIHFGVCQVEGLGVNEDVVKTNLVHIHTSTQTLRPHSHPNINTIFVEW
jgi:hypothetical protein